VIGVVLAGGAGRRMGGAKATALLDGRPLVTWALDALRAAGLPDVAVVAKGSTALPADLGAPVWVEPDEPRHPLAGVVFALSRAGGEDVVTVPVDLPLVPSEALRALASTPGCAVVRAGGRVQPLVARFPAGTRLEARGRATDAVLALGPRYVDAGGEAFLNVNSPEDLRAAEALLRAGRER
jgi:molybdopterin-guanine dinucleotide biosynthesis protein A